MRVLRAATACLASVFAGGLLVACFDLFHSTSDILSACEIDAQAKDCADSAATGFCTWSPATARTNAQHACAWLGACEGPLGGNAFGSCMFSALLAYDCTANPDHRPQGKALTYWDLLWRATTCEDVAKSIFPGGTEICVAGAAPTACGVPGSAMSNGDVRLACDGLGHGESCALWGQTCASNDAGAACTGSAGLGCASRGCADAGSTELEWCEDGGDRGIDCEGNGAQRCATFSSPPAGPWAACLPESDAGACTPSISATCDAGVAFSCPASVREQINCAALLGSAAACNPGDLNPPFDWTAPCALASQACADSCADGGLVGCWRGAAFTASCEDENLGPCREVLTATGPFPACSAP